MTQIRAEGDEVKLNKSLTAFVSHDYDRCCRSQPFRIKYLNGNQILCVDLQLVDLVTLREKKRRKEVKLRL